MTFMRAALCTAHGMSARGGERRFAPINPLTREHSSVDFPFDHAVSSTARRKVIEISKNRFVMSSQVGRLWLAIRTSYIPGRVLRKRLDAF